MKRKISTLFAGILLAFGLGTMNAASIDPSTLKTDDVFFLENGASGDYYLKVTPNGTGIIPVAKANFVLSTVADIDSVSWKVTVRENAGAMKDYTLANVAVPSLTLSFNTPSASGDSAVVSSTGRYWSIGKDAGTNYVIAYKYTTAQGDSVVALGVNTANSSDLYVTLGRAALTGSATVEEVAEGISLPNVSFEWTLSDRDVALNFMYNKTYADLKSPVITKTNIPGLLSSNFKVVPVIYNATTGAYTDGAGDNATQFMFIPADQIGKTNPYYFAVDTNRYELAGTHQDAVYGYGISKDTLITDANKLVYNGLKVFSVMYEVGAPDSLIFRPEAVVSYNASSNFTVSANPGTGVVNNGAYTYTNGEAVLGLAQLTDITLVSTVYAVNNAAGAARTEGKLASFSFAEPVYPTINAGAYFLQSKNTSSLDKYVVVNPCKVGTNTLGLDTVSTVSADHSYDVWVISKDGQTVTVNNRRTVGEWFEGQVFEVSDSEGNKYLSTTGIDTFVLVPATIKNGAVDYAEIKDPEYNKFAMSLVNNIGANIYVVKNENDSILSVSSDNTSLALSITSGTPVVYGVNNELTAIPYTFTYVIDGETYYLGLNVDSKLVLTPTVADATPFFFENGSAENQYYVHALTMDGAFLKVYATNNYIKAENAGSCTTGQDQFSFELLNTPKYMTLTPGHYTIQTVGRGDMLTMNPIDSTAVFRRISGDLKTDSYDENAFKLWVDTAAYDSNQALNVPTYFILKDAKYTDGTSILTGNFLYGSTLGDSAKFVEARREATKDSLLLYPVSHINNHVITDSIGYANGLPGSDTKAFRFMLQLTEEGSDEFYLVNEKNLYAQIENEAIIMTDDPSKAITLTLARTDSPTSNEGVAEVEDVKVIAGNGNVTILNASGKKVSVTNVLGQTVNSTVLTSDNATISAPKGLVIVVVEDAVTVKAIVK